MAWQKMKANIKSKEIKRRLRLLIPLASFEDFTAIEEIAGAGHLRHLPPSIAAWQAITTRVRHIHTEYDQLLAEGYDADSARHFVLEAMNEKLQEWGSSERISEENLP